MRYTLFQILTVVLVIALSLALFVNHRQFRLQTREHEKVADKRERLEDNLESALLDALTPGVSLNEFPHYKLLVDDIVTSSDPVFEDWVELVSEMTGDSSSALADCEVHLFSFKTGLDTAIYAVIVSDNRCVNVTWVGANIAPR